VGFVNAAADADGTIRRMDLVRFNDERVYYNLGIEAIRTLTGDSKIKVQQLEQVQSVRLNGIQPWLVPNNSQWRIKFNRTFQRINALNKDLSPVKNKIVVIGVATQQVNNWVKISNGTVRNHEVQAHFVQSLFDRNNLTTPMWADMLEMLVSMLILTSILKAAKANTPYACVPVYAGGVGVIILGSWMLFNTADLVVDWTWPVLSTSSVFALTFYYHWARKRRSEWIISKRFGDIVNATVLRQLKQKHSEIKTTGELKEITVMNADLRNFALLAAEYGSNAEGLVSAVHEYMDAILPEIVNNQGTVDKLIGDGIVAFWNAPIDVEYHALKSVKTALNMQRQIDKFNSMLTPEETPLCLDIGINTGVAVVGNTGSRKTFNYTAIGDTVKTADNLERLCKQYGVNILIGEQTVTQINRDHNTEALGYTLIELDTVFMESGNAMRVFTVDYHADPMTESHVKQHNRMLENYYAGKFDAAIRICKELKAEAKLINYYTTMINKCKAAKSGLQEDATT
jgi:adenylate cyclase